MYAGSNDASNGINDPSQSDSNGHIYHPYPQAPDSLFSHLSLRSSTSSPSGSQAHTRSSSVASTSHLHSYSSTATSESDSEVSAYPIRPLRSSASYHPELDPSQPFSSGSGSTSSQQPPATSTRASTSAEKGKAKAAASSTAAAGSSSSAKRAKKRLAEPEEDDDEDFEEGGEEDSQGVKRKLSLRTKNRLKQRAHRERRAQYLAELEAKAAILASTQDELVELKATLLSTQEDLDRSRRELEKSASMGAEREAMVRWLEGELIKARMGQPAGEMVASGRQERRSEGTSGSGSGKGSSRSSSSSHSRVSSNFSNGSRRPSSSPYHNIPSTAPPAGFASFQQQQAQHQHYHPYSSNDSSSRHASSQLSLRRPSWNSAHYPLSPSIPVLPTHLPPPPASIQHQLRLQQEVMNRAGRGTQEQTFEGWAQQQQPPMMAMAGVRMMHPTVPHQHQQQQGFPAVQGGQGHHRASTQHSEPEPFYSPNLNHERARANSDSEFLTTPINAVDSSSSSFDPDAWNTLQSYDLATAGWTNDPSSNPQHPSLSFDLARSDSHPGDPNSTFDFSPNTALPKSPAAHSISASVVPFLTDSPEMLAASPGSSSQQPSSYPNPVHYQARSQPFQSRQHPHHNFHATGNSPSPTLSSSSARPQPGQPPTRSSSLLSSLPPLQTTFAPRVSPLAPHLRPVRQSSVPSNLEQYDLNTNNNNVDRFTSSPSSINDRHDDHNVPFLSDPSINPSPISGFPSCSGSGGSEEDVRGSRPLGLPRSTSSGSASFLGFSSSTSNEATPTGPGPYASADWLSFAEGGGGGRGVESSMLGEGQAEMMISPVDE